MMMTAIFGDDNDIDHNYDWLVVWEIVCVLSNI